MFLLQGALVGGILSGSLVGWLSIGTQLKMAQKQIRFPQKSVSIEGCSNDWVVEYLTLSSSQTIEPVEMPFVFYRLSYMYYTMVGAVTAIVVGVVVSYLTGRNKNEIHRDLLSPLIYPFLKKQKDEMEMKSVNGAANGVKDVS